jgi:hypothetical protein
LFRNLKKWGIHDVDLDHHGADDDSEQRAFSR